MQGTDIVAFAYDAAIHCVDCASEHFDCDPADAVDSEGNEVHPVFASDEGWADDTCDDCGLRIEDTL
jgi:hypothetical protein